MSSQRYRRDRFDCDPELERHSRSTRSKSHSRRQRRHDTRSRTRSLERRHRHHRSSRSRSRSRDYISRRDVRYSHRHRRSRSQSRSSSRSSFHHSRSGTPSLKLKQSGKRIPEYFKDNGLQILRSERKHGEIDVANLPLPKREIIGAYYNLDTDEPFDKERIHREMEEKLRQTLAKEGKVYPPPKPEASHPVFANDGSFLEIFKKMQESQGQVQQNTATEDAAVSQIAAAVASTSTAVYVAATAAGKSAPPPPIFGRRRGGKILKTGVVAKQKTQAENGADPKDFWSLYLAEVNKYKKTACETDNGTRPLVK